MKETAEAYLCVEVTHAVITVPGHLTANVKQPKTYCGEIHFRGEDFDNRTVENFIQKFKRKHIFFSLKPESIVILKHVFYIMICLP